MDKIFTHTDLDGIGCAVLAKYYNPDIEVEYCDYDNVNEKVNKFLDKSIPLGDLYITDISISDEVAQRIDNTPTDFLLLDHHATALDLNKYSWCTVKTVDENTGIQTCGTELFYNLLIDYGYLSRSNRLDKFVETIRDYDTWRWATLGKKGMLSKNLNDLFHIYGRDYFVDWCIDSLQSNTFPDFGTTEETLLRIRQDEINGYVGKKNQELFTLPLCGKVCGVVFANKFISELGNRLCKLHPEIDFVAMIDVESCTVSYRTIKDDIDLGQDVAKLFGGGGHPKAAGSPFDKEILLGIVRKIFMELCKE